MSEGSDGLRRTEGFQEQPRLGSAPWWSSQLVEELQQRGQGPGLALAAEGAVLPVLVGQLWETLPRGPEETHRSPP